MWMYNSENPKLDGPGLLEEVIAVLKRISSNKAPGLDGIPNAVLKALPDEWIATVIQLFNHTLR